MPCCGGKREQFHKRTPGQETNEAIQAGSPQRQVSSVTVYFEYIGKTGLTVVGPITGSRYRFDGPGAIVAVDGRDASPVAAVPNLRQVRHGA